MSATRDIERRFQAACDFLFGELAPNEALSIDFSGEASLFMRFNRGLVRQIGEVDSASVSFKYMRDGRTLATAVSLSGGPRADADRLAAALASARREAALLPEDPYQTLPEGSGSSREEFAGKLPEPEAMPETVLGPGAVLAEAGADFVGLHAQGAACRGAATSAGARHWFATETFVTDYSAFMPNGKAVKSCYAGREWDGPDYLRRLEAERPRLEALKRQERVIPPGEYRVYIAPDALAEFMVFFSWNGIGERELREGESAWIALKEGRKALSPRFRLVQDFGLGVEQRFNEAGEVAPERLVLIEGGKLANSLVSARSAKQYGVASNAAPEGEGLRSASVDAGELDEADALRELGRGLYISNLHYLNWSDFDSARITGMTRFACFWVEGGEIAAPIKDMRFDESLYRLLGDKLLALSRQRSLVPEVGTYFQRSLGGALLPGLLAEGFTFTL